MFLVTGDSGARLIPFCSEPVQPRREMLSFHGRHGILEPNALVFGGFEAFLGMLTYGSP